MLKKQILLVVISASFVIAGHFFVLQRTLNGSTIYLTIRADTNSYVSMIEGEITSTSVPFKHRLLVPLLARALPLSPTESLRVISYLSLFFCYFFILLTCAEMKVPLYASVAGLFSIFATTGHLYNYHNPFLTDAFALMGLSLMMFALATNSFILFACTAVIGVLAREQILFMVPAGLLVWKDLRKSVPLIVLVLLALIIPRYLLPPEAGLAGWLFPKFNTALSPSDVGSLVLRIIHTWGITWLIALLGLFYLPANRFYGLVISFCLLLSGAFLTSLGATDTIRMFSILAPILGVTVAFFFVNVAKVGRPYLVGCWTLLLIQGVTAIPNALIGEHNLILTRLWSAAVLTMLGMVLVSLVLIVFRRSLLRAFGEKMNLFRMVRPKAFSNKLRAA